MKAANSGTWSGRAERRRQLRPKPRMGTILPATAAPAESTFPAVKPELRYGGRVRQGCGKLHPGAPELPRALQAHGCKHAQKKRHALHISVRPDSTIPCGQRRRESRATRPDDAFSVLSVAVAGRRPPAQLCAAAPGMRGSIGAIRKATLARLQGREGSIQRAAVRRVQQSARYHSLGNVEAQQTTHGS